MPFWLKKYPFSRIFWAKVRCLSSGASCCLGVAQPLSGKRAERGQDLLNGLNLAVANINKEGFKLNGKSLAGSAEAELQKANKTIAIR